MFQMLEICVTKMTIQGVSLCQGTVRGHYIGTTVCLLTPSQPPPSMIL